MSTWMILAGAVTLVVAVWAVSSGNRDRRSADGNDSGAGMFYGDDGSSDPTANCPDPTSDGDSCDGSGDDGGGDD